MPLRGTYCFAVGAVALSLSPSAITKSHAEGLRKSEIALFAVRVCAIKSQIVACAGPSRFSFYSVSCIQFRLRKYDLTSRSESIVYALYSMWCT